MRRKLLLVLLAAALLTVPVFADMGPRPCLKNGKTPSWGIFFRQDCVDLT